MKHEKTLAIRTLTEAMLNARSAQQYPLADLLSEEITRMILPQAPAETVANEQPAEEVQCATGPSNADIVRGFCEDNCPCCVVFDHLVAGQELPTGNESFLYELGKGAGFEALRSTMIAVADRVKAGQEDGSIQSTTEFTINFGEFTHASFAAHQRLANEGYAPKPVKVQAVHSQELVAALARIAQTLRAERG